MALQTTTEIFISGVPVQSYISIKLSQEISKHNELELVCRADVVERLSEELVGDSKEYLGGIITLRISSVSDFGGYKELEFKGVVTKVKASKGFHQSSGDLVTICAKSTSILSEDGNHYASFSDVSLSEILERTFQGYDRGKLETNFAPVSSDTIHFSIQYNQSAFSYVSRLAANYNEWFYYDGKKLVFGSPSTEETTLSYGIDLQNFSVELNTIPNSFDYLTSDHLVDGIHRKSSDEVSTESNGYHGFMNNKSKELYNKKSQIYYTPYSDTSLQSRFDKQVEQYTRARSIRQAVATGSSDNPGVNLGEIITVKGYGSYRVIKVTHTNNEGGKYQNHFEAVDANSTDYPLMDLHSYPSSEIQIAKVIENNDVDNLARVRVQFPWQKKTGEMTPWIRLMTPHAGADKGFHFIPEIGEEVIVNFEGGNAEKPFVMGALYNGSAKPSSWQSDANDIKAIKTRSGHLIELNDTDGSEKILISDKNSNLISIDTANNNIEISALENMTLNAKNFQLNVEEDASINVGKNTTIETGENLDMSSSNMTNTVDDELREEIGGTYSQIASETEIQSDGDVKIQSAGLATLKGGSDVKISKG
ncbi:type VI secretion system Vgr family protein [Aquimarina sp. RZ0]|uniref:type VI secretion system Vgr family protein n=1 Tax=Aquimarina sp. RZ0 TaxID=2607730 RepID=UPI0011F1F7B4|nr:phage baseplate assembly protein V [Aquimarina sp. RZ0]KAA1242356.1 hypothetical protein F0000_25940 [Aquimarina sp. RZ0]